MGEVGDGTAVRPVWIFWQALFPTRATRTFGIPTEGGPGERLTAIAPGAACVLKWRHAVRAFFASTIGTKAQEFYFREGLTDGLPIVPPTPERVSAMLEHCGLAPDYILGVEGIRRKTFQAESVAVNAVMAGCLPEHFPVVAAAISAICDRTYNLHASSTSTNGIANLVMVSGPYASHIGMNPGVNLMGQANPGQRGHRTSDQPGQSQLLWLGRSRHGQKHLRPSRQIQLLLR